MAEDALNTEEETRDGLDASEEQDQLEEESLEDSTEVEEDALSTDKEEDNGPNASEEEELLEELES